LIDVIVQVYRDPIPLHCLGCVDLADGEAVKPGSFHRAFSNQNHSKFQPEPLGVAGPIALSGLLRTLSVLVPLMHGEHGRYLKIMGAGTGTYLCAVCLFLGVNF
jgi:hypothetical protein